MILVLVLSVWSVAVEGNLQVRNSVGDNSPRRLVDGLIETAWTAAAAGEEVGFLLEDPLLIDSSFATSNKPNQSWYRLLGSMNYRDWVILSEGPGVDYREDNDVETFALEKVQYLRFVNLEEGPAGWELLAGLRAEVEGELTLLRPPDWGDITDPTVIEGMLELAFDWQLANESDRQNGTGWVNGAFYTGVSAMYAATGREKYREAILNKGESADWNLRLRTTGKTFYHADDHCLGQSWLELYILEENPSQIWIDDVKNRLDQVMASPLAGDIDMNWCDALYMSPPNYGRMAFITSNDAYQEFIDGQWWDVTDHLYDQSWQLFYRDASYFNDLEPNGMPVFWSRGNGWVLGGLVRMLEYMPEDWPDRGRYIVLLKEMSAALAAIQGEDGLWSSSLLYPEKYDMERETSGSAFFAYAMAWGVNEGILDKDIYGPVVEAAWVGLSEMLTSQGTLLYIQQVGAGPALNNGEFPGKDYGYGAFLLAGIEMMRYFEEPVSAYARRDFGYLESVSSITPASTTDWTVIDDFESEFSWTERKTVAYSGMTVADPQARGGSHVFSIYTGSRTPGIYRATVAIPPIAEGSKSTLYQRFSYDNPEVDILFGISDVGVVGEYNDYENGFRIVSSLNQAEVRDGDRYVAVSEDLLQLETWYEIWMVINNSTDTYDVYIQGGSNYPEQTLLMSDITFRNGTTSPIASFSISYNSDYCEGTFFMDDIHIDSSGVNLTRPQGVHQPLYSPWSDIGRGQFSGLKNTASGRLCDNYFPWIYHADIGAWYYIPSLETDSVGYYGWNPTKKGWIWFSESSLGWYFDYAQKGWILYGD